MTLSLATWDVDSGGSISQMSDKGLREPIPLDQPQATQWVRGQAGAGLESEPKS